MKKTRKILLSVLSVLTVAAVSLGAASCELLEMLGQPVPPIDIPTVDNSSSDSSSSQTTDNEFRQVYAMYVVYAKEQGTTPLSYEEWLKSIRGDKGDKGDKGEQGPQGEKGDKGDQGEQGEDGKDGQDGKDGVGIEKVEYDADGNLVITFTDGTTQTVVMPEPETHVHTFGKWTAFTTDDTPCDNRLFFRVCSDCKSIEWKQGEYTDHDWTVVTTPPTCQAQGYDTKTCSICGKVEVENYTDIVDHAWATEYTFDNSFHWYECNTCNEIKDKAEHTPDESGECTVCKALVGATEGVVYDVFDGGAYAGVIGYEGTATRVRIADTYNGLPVKTIYDQAFNNNDKITSVIIPDNVTSIGSRAFDDCDSLTSVVIGDSVTSIGERAFSFCDSLTSVEIPDSVTSIGDYAFNSCSSLTFHEYGNCQYLGNEENPYHALIQAKTENYSAYTIHEDTKVIADYAFSGCTRMSSIVIPDSVTSIGNGAFYECSSLTSVAIPDSVTSIGYGAFEYCSSLTSVVIGNGVTSIGYGAFEYCSSLTSVVIGDSVTSIGYGAFYNCSSLTSVVIGDSVTSIGGYAFDGCSSLTSVYYKGTASEWSAISMGANNSSLWNATRYYYSETEPTSAGRYWHYVDGVPTKW